jgi:hypothetical protein
MRLCYNGAEIRCGLWLIKLFGDRLMDRTQNPVRRLDVGYSTLATRPCHIVSNHATDHHLCKGKSQETLTNTISAQEGYWIQDTGRDMH